MKKRIFGSMLLLIILGALVLSVALCAVFYLQLAESVRDEVQQRARMLSETTSGDDFVSLSTADMRLTHVSPDGMVLFDNTTDTSALENHMDREEIREALQTGTGESTRFSNTLRQETYYFALCLDDGSVLRVAKTTNSIWAMFAGALPVACLILLCVLAVGYWVAGRLTRRIVAPINGVDLEDGLSVPYDELAPFIATIQRQRGHIASQMEDIRERTRTIEAIIDNMNEGIILLDKSGSVLSANSSACQMLGCAGQPRGKSLLEITRDMALIERMREALTGQRSEINHDLGGRMYRIFFSPVTESGALILFLDVTERVMAETLRREFSANVSHELKTPLTTIYGNAEMLAGGMVKEEDKQSFYDRIESEAARLIALIEDIILISRLDEEAGDHRVEDVDLTQVACEVVESLSQKAADRDVRVKLTGEEVTLSANRSQMLELLYNLIDNAIKYNRPSGEVSIDVSRQDERARITVADTGIGIPREAQGRVFERFYRVDKSRSKQTGGTGLGLAIVKHIVQARGGSIDLTSRESQGTTIRVVL